MGSLAHYNILKKIGHGSYGKIWLVNKIQEHKKLVLKEIDFSEASSREKDSARQECQLLKSFEHPNIVQYRDSFEENNCLYIAMQYCEGGDLYTKLKNRKGVLLSEKQIIEWLIQITMALSYIHEKNILHRDLKTQNIFLSRSVIKLGDLGIAKQLEQKHDMAQTVIGTPYYMSPELFGRKPYNFKSDVWSLGCVTYEMITLKHAFQAKNFTALSYKILNGETPDMPSGYSEELISLIKDMLHKNPEKRPHTRKILSNSYIRLHIKSFVKETKRSTSAGTAKVCSKQIKPLDAHNKDSKISRVLPQNHDNKLNKNIEKNVEIFERNKKKDEIDYKDQNISASPLKAACNDKYDDNDDVVIARSSNDSQSRSSTDSSKDQKNDDNKFHRKSSKTELEKELQKDFINPDVETEGSQSDLSNIPIPELDHLCENENAEKKNEVTLKSDDKVVNIKARQKRRQKKRDLGLGTIRQFPKIDIEGSEDSAQNESGSKRKYNREQPISVPLPELIRYDSDAVPDSLNFDALQVVERMNETLTVQINPGFANIKDSLLLYEDSEIDDIGPKENEEETLSRTRFHNKRYQEIRKEIMKTIGYDVMSKCFQILKDMSSDHETELRHILKERYETYVDFLY